MKDIASNIVDFFGALHRNLLRDEDEQVEIGPDSRSAILAVLWRRGDCTMTDLSRLLRVTKSNITFLVDRMEEQGMLRRLPDADDRRKILIHLSEQGRKEIESKRIRVLTRVEDKLNLLNPDEQKYIEETLPRIMQILSKLYSTSTN